VILQVRTGTIPQRIGAYVIDLVEATGQVVLLFQDVIRSLWRYPIRWALFFQQTLFVGARSQSVVIITGAFTGAVFAAQTQYQFGPLGMNSAVGPVVSVSMCRELGPVLCALMVAGRVGAAMAAELGTMKITEQIDALRALAVYPTEYLIVPRFLAMILSMPLLVAVAIACGIAAGYIVAVPILGVDGTYYWDNTLKFTKAKDVSIGLIKGFMFAIIIVMISCYKGLHSRPGAEGVGQATTEAVVVSSIAVLIANFFFSFLLNIIFPA
jgi:phospholipid/cholesterol/gamma-HCH transport system permease protein